MLLEADEGDLEVKIQEGVEAEMGVGPEISLHAFNGCIVPKTMRIQARIGSLELIILIDSISTHNFIQDKVVVALKLTLTPMQAFSVTEEVNIKHGLKLRYRSLTRTTPRRIGHGVSVAYWSISKIR